MLAFGVGCMDYSIRIYFDNDESVFTEGCYDEIDSRIITVFVKKDTNIKDFFDKKNFYKLLRDGLKNPSLDLEEFSTSYDVIKEIIDNNIDVLKESKSIYFDIGNICNPFSSNNVNNINNFFSSFSNCLFFASVISLSVNISNSFGVKSIVTPPNLEIYPFFY